MQTLVSGTLSSWVGTAEMPFVPPLSRNSNCEICIIGAGIAGLTTAYMLSREGRSVVVIDSGQPASGESGRTSAHLCSANDDGFVEIERLHGIEGSQMAYASHAAAIDKIDEIVRWELIDCDFCRVDGYLFKGSGKSEAVLDEEFAAAQHIGFPGVEQQLRPPIGSFGAGRCNRYPMQGQFHPYKYMAGLVRAILREGGKIYSDAHVLEVKEADGGGFDISTEGGWQIHSDVTVVATNSPITSLVSIHTKQAAYRSYVIGFRIKQDAIPLALYWDTDDPYHYARIQELRDGSGEDLLIIGGEDHKTGQDEHHDPEFHFARLRDWQREYFPMAGVEEFHWSGQIQETLDGLAHIGHSPTGPASLYVATGDSGMGLTHGTIAGMIITDQINGRHNPWEKLYDPSRVRAGGLGKWTRENLNVALQYKDYLITPDKKDSYEHIAPGTGAIVMQEGHRIAAYRDEEGALHRCSAVCTHLGGIVHWNSVEKTWDCPCHGARYSPDGAVLNGPASHPLEPAPVTSK